MATFKSSVLNLTPSPGGGRYTRAGRTDQIREGSGVAKGEGVATPEPRERQAIHPPRPSMDLQATSMPTRRHKVGSRRAISMSSHNTTSLASSRPSTSPPPSHRRGPAHHTHGAPGHVVSSITGHRARSRTQVMGYECDRRSTVSEGHRTRREHPQAGAAFSAFPAFVIPPGWWGLDRRRPGGGKVNHGCVVGTVRVTARFPAAAGGRLGADQASRRPN
jgi:hypothetical protein